VEQIARERTYPELEPLHPPRLRLSPLLLIVIVLLIGFAVINLGVRTLAQYSLPPSNPFPAYADIFPGQPANAILSREFSCWGNDFYEYSYAVAYGLTQESCIFIFTPAEGIFSHVEAVISGDTIQTLTFLLRDKTLQVGDLEKLLEMPTLHTLHNTAYFFLPEDFVIAKTVDFTGQFSLFLPVWSISFTDMNLLT
jgi:hypothetical protein